MSNKSKKIRNARIIATDIFMFIAVIAIVFLMMLIAMGFKFNDDGDLEQSGLLQVSSHPSSAKVTIDGNELLMPTEISKLLSIGEHDLKVTKTGYDTWNSTVSIESGLLTEISWVRLFPLDPKLSDVDTFDTAPSLVNVSDSRKYILTAKNGASNFDLLSIQEEKLKSTTINFSDIISIAPAEGETSTPVTPEEFSVVAWSGNDSKILMKHVRDNKVNWILVNTAKPKESINLTSVFDKTFTQVLLQNESATKAWALADGQLLQLDLSNKTIVKTIASNVKKISSMGDTVSYIALSSEDVVFDTTESAVVSDEVKEATNKIFIYKDGEESATSIVDLGSDDASSILEMGTYWSDNWLAYNKGNKIFVRSGVYPSYNKSSAEDFPIVIENEIAHPATLTEVNSEGRIIMLADQDDITSLDLETKKFTTYKTDTAQSKLNWLDSYLLWLQKDNKLIVWDFDGGNHREIVQKTHGNYPATISSNNKYLYYFTSEEIADTSAKNETTTEQTEGENSTTSENGTPKTKTIYHLTRMKL